MHGKENFTVKCIKAGKRILGISLSVCLLAPFLSSFAPASEVYAARLMRLSTAKSVAVARSEKIEALELQIQSKQAAKESALRAIREKERNMSTFRWSPLLDFSFPTEPDEAEAFEFRYKPTQLQYDIDTLNHKITDQKLTEFQDVSSIYMDIITAQVEVTFLKQRITNMETAIVKNKARLAEGTVSQDTIDQQQSKVDGLKESLASEERKLLRAEEKLSDKLGFSVTSGYVFEEAFTSTNIDRDNIEYLQVYARDRDQTVYEAKQAEELARLALMTNFELCRGQYGNNIGMISTYVQQAMDGSPVNKKAFKKDYDDFLKKIDEPWTGKKKILFFSFPKEWWKGDIDGIRFVEDDPYVLYQSALDYESALKEYNNAVKELNTAVSDGFDNYIETRRAYVTAQRNLVRLQQKLIYDEALNALGQLSLDEFEAELEEYENSRSALNEALTLYTSTLFEYDRTTCGGASAYFTEESLATQAGYGGLNTPEGYGSLEADLARMNAVVKKGATYSIRPIVDSQEFMLYINITDDFEYDVTHFELWSDNRQIGERVAVGESIRHLRLTIQDVDSVFIRLYNGNTFVDDCTIDPTVSYGPLNITVAHVIEDEDLSDPIGSYTVEEDTNTEMIKIRFTFDVNAVKRNYSLGTEVAFYNLSTERNLYLFSNDLIEADTPFTYMSFIKGDLGKLTVRLFGEDGSYIGGASFDTATKKLYADKEITLEDMQEMAARMLVAERKAADLAAEISRLKDLYNTALSMDPYSETVTYYSERIAELERQLMDVANSVTAEEIAAALESDAEEIERRVSEMKLDNEDTEETEEEELSDEELNARNVILREATVELIREIRASTTKEQLQNTITEKEREIAKALREYNAAMDKGDAEEAARLKEVLESLQKEVDVAQAKMVVVDADESSITEEDMEFALREYGDLIYAKAEERLTDAMLWGSETGQWAKAYLEASGLPVDEASMREIIKNAGGFAEYEYMQNRQALMARELEEAKAKVEKYKDSDSVTEQNLAKQLQKMAETYEKEMETLRVDLKKKDPGKEVKVRALKEQLGPLEELLAQKEEERSQLVSVLNPVLGEYKRAETEEYTAATTVLNAIVKEHDNKKKELDEDITKKQNLQDNEPAVQADFEAKRESYQLSLAAAREEYMLKMADSDYKAVDNDRWYTYFWPSRGAIKNKISQMRSDVSYWETMLDSLNKEFERFTTQERSEAYYEQLRSDLAEAKGKLETLEEAYAKELPPAQDRVRAANQKVLAKEKEWYDSEDARVRLEGEIADIKKQINAIHTDINEYY